MDREGQRSEVSRSHELDRLQLKVDITYITVGKSLHSNVSYKLSDASSVSLPAPRLDSSLSLPLTNALPSSGNWREQRKLTNAE